MGYYNKSGYVGDYKGKEVYVINREDYTKGKVNNESIIYAIRQEDGIKLDLVFKGYRIGLMWDNGNVLTVEKTPWVFKKASKSKSKSKVKTENKVKKEDIDIDNYDFSIDFSEYETVVNDVFKNLETWWKDLEKEGA